MQLYFVIVACVAVCGVAAGGVSPQGNRCRPQCQADACLREVVGKELWPGPWKAFDDCESYLRTTTTPVHTVTYTPLTAAATTVTTTATVTATVDTTTTVPPLLQRHLSATPSIPAYAHDCHNPSQYRSACSCIYAPTCTVTAPASTHTVTASARITGTSTSTVTQTTTTTTTVAATVTAAVATFYIQAVDAADSTTSYFEIENAGQYIFVYGVESVSNASPWSLGADGDLYSTEVSFYAYPSDNGGTSYVAVGPASQFTSVSPLTCSMSGTPPYATGDTGTLTCTDPGYPYDRLCSGRWTWLASDVNCDVDSATVTLQYVILTPGF